MGLNICSADILQDLAQRLAGLAAATETHVQEKIQECCELQNTVDAALTRVREEIASCEASLRVLEMNLRNAQMAAMDSEGNYVPVPDFLLEDLQIERERLGHLERNELLLQYKKNELDAKTSIRIAEYRRWKEEYRARTEAACGRLGELHELLDTLQGQQLFFGVKNESGSGSMGAQSAGKASDGTEVGQRRTGVIGNICGWISDGNAGGWKTIGGQLGNGQDFLKKKKKQKKKKKGTGMTGTPRILSETAQEWHRDADGSLAYNSPVETGQKLDACQGKIAEFQGTCGLCSCVNIIRMSGAYIQEEAMVDFASKNGLCVSGRDADANGGTSFLHRQEILESYGIDSFCCRQSVGSIERYVAAGRGVIVSVDAGALWYDKPSNEMHAVVVTSVRKDYLGNVKGFYICDSGTLGPDSARFIPVQKMAGCLSENQMNVTSYAIR